MLCVLAFCTKDQDITFELFEWLRMIGGSKNHNLLLCRDHRCNKDTSTKILVSAKESFGNVTEITAQASVDGWPAGSNYMFKLCAGHVEHMRGIPYFFWLEPDAIPLTADWLDRIEAEYLASGKAFMGDDVRVEGIPRHMSGVAVYQNPIHKLAGQINWANDVAWDMVGKDQIIPNAHFTKLIEHAWRHPTFTDLHELSTQIRPEAVLFHASKDGSLINLLRQQRTKAYTPTTHAKEGDAIVKETVSNSTTIGNAALTVQPVGAADIFIRTYPADYPWLAYCLKSIQKFCTGFRKTWIISTAAAGLPIDSFPNLEWKVMNEETEDGYLAQQIHKLYADVILDYEADYILFMDSDTLFTTPVTPATFFTSNKPTWYMTPYDKIETPWKPIVEKFMQKPVEYEFMRRHPMVVPRWLFPRLREYCHAKHGRIISEYIKNQPYREFSEFNALGAFAYEKYRDKFAWVNTEEVRMPPAVVRQFFSWGGITEEVKSEIDTILSVPVLAEPSCAPKSCEGGEARESTKNTPTGRVTPDSLGGQKLLSGGAPDIPGAHPTAVASPSHLPGAGEASEVGGQRPSLVPSQNHAVTIETLKEHIGALAEFARQSRGNRIRVGQQLSKAGLK